MMNFCDLHTHSTYSDGTCTPEELVCLAKQAGLRALALCDHNTVAGLPEFLAAAKNASVEAIAGTELSTDFMGTELHILGLFLKPEHYAPISERVAGQTQRKEQSNRDLVEKLAKAGYVLDYESIKASTPSGNVNRALIGAELTRLGYTESVQAAFHTLLSPKNGYYTPPSLPDALDTVAFLKNLGCVVVAAHPLLSMDEAKTRKFLPPAKAAGLDGMEVFYPKYDEKTTALAQSLAAEFGLHPSGGSDFHGRNKPDIQIGVGRGNLQIPFAWANALKRIIE